MNIIIIRLTYLKERKERKEYKYNRYKEVLYNISKIELPKIYESESTCNHVIKFG